MYYILYWNIDRFEVVRQEFSSYEEAEENCEKIETCKAIIVKKCD